MKINKKAVGVGVFAGLLVFSMLYTKFKDGHINPHKTITFDEDYVAEPVTEEEVDYSDYQYGDVASEDTVEGIEEDISDYDEEDDFQDTPSEYVDDLSGLPPAVVMGDNYSKSPAGFYDSLNSTVEDIAIVDDANIDVVLQGLIMGYVSDCWFVTNQFRDEYANGFLPDVQTVEVLESDITSGTATVLVNGGTSYNVYFTIVDSMIDSLSLSEI